MSKKHKTNRNNNNNNKATTPPQAGKRTTPIGVGIVLVVVAVVCVGLWWWKTNHAQASQPIAALTQAKSASVAVTPDFEKLKGRWLRTDGGYVLEIKQVANDGKMDAAYLNPKLINVSKASASTEEGKIKVFVELRDRLYPGNYYKLTYDAGKDQLAGVYYHLGIGQQFDVVFVRMK